MNVGRTEALPPEDIRYVGQVVAQRTGLSQQDAEKRVIDGYARAQAKLRDAETAARNAADKARKASAYGALWLFVSLLIGASWPAWQPLTAAGVATLDLLRQHIFSTTFRKLLCDHCCCCSSAFLSQSSS